MKHVKSLLLSLLFLLGSAASQAQVITGKLPLNYKLWYQQNNEGDKEKDQGFQQLSNGITAEYVVMGWGKVLSNYDCYYEFQGLKNVQITRVKLAQGWNGIDSPVKFYTKSSPAAALVPLTTYAGGTTQDVTLSAPVSAQYLVMNVTGNSVPSEIELYGTYELAPVALYPLKEVKMQNLLGDNSFIWEFVGASSDVVDEGKMQRMRAFTQYRDYVDWGRLEATEGVYTFDYTASGSWNYDNYYTRCKAEGKDVLMCVKTVPQWFLDKYYNGASKNEENVPAPWGSDRLSPASYLAQAKLGFQIAARYGRNKAIDPALQAGVSAGLVYPSWATGPSRSRKAGLDLLTYIECENERDKWWKGREAYQTGREYAANLSAFYDGHLGTLGAGVGIKTADPTMQVVMAGTAAANTDYVRGIIDWCKQYRGYKADGSVNLCFDVVNYHLYANSNGVSQSAGSASGAAPEVAGLAAIADDFLAVARQHNLEVWVTETGYDLNQQSPLHAFPIGSKGADEVAADWTLRTALLYARHGVKRVFHYQTYDNGGGNGQFDSSGLLKADGTRRPAADYLYQVNALMGKYVYKETLSQNPFVDRYEYQGKSAYVVTMPTQSGATTPYTLAATSGKLYRPTIGSDSMRSVTIGKGNNTITASETPYFFFPSAVAAPPLPVTLTRFSGRVVPGKKIEATWETATEVNSAYFEVEMSPDGLRFQVAATVAAQGTSAQPHTYTTLVTPLTDVVYLRLRSVDNDGSNTYSQVKVFNLGSSAEKEYIVQDQDLSYSFTLPLGEKPDRLLIYDSIGRLLSTQDADNQVLPHNYNGSMRVLVLLTKSGKRYGKQIR
jgi:endoglucanase